MTNTDRMQKLQNELDSYETIFGSNFLIRNSEILAIINSNNKVYVLFDFDWENYNSWIIIKGADDLKEYIIRTPQIPLLGGCWSNYVATRCMTGQVLVSAMLESVFLQMEFIVRENNKNTRVVLCDNCFYAPFLYYTANERGELCSGIHQESHLEYHDLLKKGNPKAYEQVCGLEKGENYWNKFHDKF